MRHGAESFWIEGEGLVGTSLGGRSGEAAADPVDTGGAPTPQAVDVPPFRFSRLGPRGGRRLSERTLRRVAKAMIAEGREGEVPAGYTYLGQFVDHDLTFDRTSVALGEDVTPADLLQGRSPSLDLDSLYGAGPDDEESARFYAEDGRHLLTGRTERIGSDRARDGFDLPRTGGDGPPRRQRRALVPELRNDENLAVAQTHAAFIRFHNRVLDEAVPARVPEAQRFARARRKVTKHYQWLLRTDYLPRIVDPAVVDDVFTHGRKVVEPTAAPLDVPTMPVEFSVAAFRLGHSMVRSSYSWNARFDDGAGSLDLLFTFSGTSGDLGGGVRLPSNWIADWRRMYDFAEAGRDDLVLPRRKTNRAMRLDTRLVDPLRNLPTGSFGGPAVPFDDIHANLAYRNLERARMLRLATGQQVVALLQEAGVAVTPLTDEQVLEGRRGAVLDGLTDEERTALAARTPLWFYVLREAEVGDGRLSGVGARLVAETFHRAMEGSRASIVRNPDWRPELGPDPDTFRMVDLLLFACDGREDLLNPLGD